MKLILLHCINDGGNSWRCESWDVGQMIPRQTVRMLVDGNRSNGGYCVPDCESKFCCDS